MSREQIRRVLWPEGGFLDHEQAINFAIRKIRIALGDSARAPRFIETVPRLGYRFIAVVREEARPAPSLEDISPPHLSAALESRTEDESPLPVEVPLPATPASFRSTVPLAFVVGMVLFVIPFSGGHEGSTASAPEDPATEKSAASAPSSPSPLSHTAPASAEAPDLDEAYLQGRFLVEQDSPEEIELGIHKLREAISRQPDFAPSHLALARGFLALSRDQHFNIFMPEVEEKVGRALELDPSLAEAHRLRSEVLFVFRHDWQGAETAIRLAISLEAEESPEGLRQRAMISAARGRTSEAVTLMKRAVAIDPAALLDRSDLVLCLMYDRRYAEALAASKASLEIAPSAQKSLFLDATLRHHLGDEAGAMETYDAYFKTWNQERPESLDAVYAWFFRFGEAQRSAGKRAHLPLALLHALTDRPQKSLEHLVEACDHDPHWELPMVGVDPRFDTVRRLPGYSQLTGCLPATS